MSEVVSILSDIMFPRSASAQTANVVIDELPAALTNEIIISTSLKAGLIYGLLGAVVITALYKMRRSDAGRGRMISIFLMSLCAAFFIAFAAFMLYQRAQ